MLPTRCQTLVRRSPAARCSSLAALLLLGPAAAAGVPLSPEGGGEGPRPSVVEAVQALLDDFGTREAKYESLAKTMDKRVAAALEQGVWRPAGDAGEARALGAHPRLALVTQLARSVAGSKRPRPEVAALLSTWPWREELELVDGLQYGSDRAIPTHQNGFIDLGAAPAPGPGFPELCVNTYLWGTGEVVGWRYRVDDRKSPRFEGRGPKDGPQPAGELPGWERVRVLLQGVQPETASLGLHGLTHAIHARGVERRRTPEGELDGMDRLAALLDSRWNGFLVRLPHAKEPLAIVQPVHALIADRTGFLYRFPQSERLARVGDLPFVSVTTQVAYGQEFLDLSITPGDLVRRTPDAERVVERFWQDCAYLTRYKLLIDEIVRAVLTPHLAYPESLRAYDFDGGALPAADAPDAAFDVPRGHALLVWAWAGGDPARVADFLHDELIAVAGNRFPSQASLPILFTTLVREREAELLEAVAERVEAERAARGAGAGPGDFELELSPYAELGGGGAPALRHLVRRFHAFHAPLSRAIADAAWEVVEDEL